MPLADKRRPGGPAALEICEEVMDEECFMRLFAGFTLRQSNIAMEHGPFEDVFPIKTGDIPLLC